MRCCLIFKEEPAWLNIKMWACKLIFFYQNLGKFRITLSLVGYILESNQMSAKIYRLVYVLACPHFSSQPSMPEVLKHLEIHKEVHLNIIANIFSSLI